MTQLGRVSPRSAAGAVSAPHNTGSGSTPSDSSLLVRCFASTPQTRPLVCKDSLTRLLLAEKLLEARARWRQLLWHDAVAERGGGAQTVLHAMGDDTEDGG